MEQVTIKLKLLSAKKKEHRYLPDFQAKYIMIQADNPKITNSETMEEGQRCPIK